MSHTVFPVSSTTTTEMQKVQYQEDHKHKSTHYFLFNNNMMCGDLVEQGRILGMHVSSRRTALLMFSHKLLDGRMHASPFFQKFVVTE